MGSRAGYKFREARGHDAQALVAEFGEKIMYMPSNNTSKSAPKMYAKFHDGIWLGLRMKNDESIIGTPNGVIKAKTVRRLPVDQRWCAEEVLSIRGLLSNPVPGVGGDPISIEADGSRHAERGEDERTPAQEHEKCDALPTVAAPDTTVRRMYITRSHIREYGATEGCPGCKGDPNRQINATQQINTGKEEGLFAATPALEALRMLLSTTVTGNKSKSLLFNVICRACMHARPLSDINVELCDEEKTEPGDEHRYGKLVKSMYGTGIAAHDW